MKQPSGLGFPEKSLSLELIFDKARFFQSKYF